MKNNNMQYVSIKRLGKIQSLGSPLHPSDLFKFLPQCHFSFVQDSLSSLNPDFLSPTETVTGVFHHFNNEKINKSLKGG